MPPAPLLVLVQLRATLQTAWRCPGRSATPPAANASADQQAMTSITSKVFGHGNGTVDHHIWYDGSSSSTRSGKGPYKHLQAASSTGQ